MRLPALALAALICAACTGGDGTGSSGDPAEHPLAEVPLRPAEAPQGLVSRDRGTGPIVRLREVLPPRRTAPGLPPVPGELQQAFDSGYQRLYSRGSRSAASSALRFADATAAMRFVELLGEIHDAAFADEGLLPAPGVGEEGYAWEHAVPGARSAGAVWRRGDLVVTLILSGPSDGPTSDDVRALARRVDGRLT